MEKFDTLNGWRRADLSGCGTKFPNSLLTILQKYQKNFWQSFTIVELLRYKHISNIGDDHRTYPIGSTNVELLRQSWNVSKVEPPMFSGLYSDTLLRAEP